MRSKFQRLMDAQKPPARGSGFFCRPRALRSRWQYDADRTENPRMEDYDIQVPARAAKVPLAPTAAANRPGPKALRYRAERISYWNNYERRRPGRYYHEEIRRIYQFLVPPGLRVLELGCGEGDLLAALKPRRGVGIDFSPRMVERARANYPQLEVFLGDVHDLKAG